MSKIDQSLNENIGIYYSSKDYAGFSKRVLAWAVDLIVILIAIGFYTFIFLNYSSSQEYEIKILFWISLITCHVYLAVLKNTEHSTLGFKLTDIKVVDLYGKRPSFFKMTFRFFLLVLGPFEFIIDILWLTGEDTKQTLRDKFVGTYVVKRGIEPIGTGKIIQSNLCVMGWNLLFSEVAIPEGFYDKKQ